MATYVGVDVSKQTLDVQCGEVWLQVENTSLGLKKLIKRLKHYIAQGHTLEAVVCEASGGYERPLILALHQAGYPVHLANARKVRNFAKCKGYLAKTDKLDA
jgi:transposase